MRQILTCQGHKMITVITMKMNILAKVELQVYTLLPG
jgi:hypothetical protein